MNQLSKIFDWLQQPHFINVMAKYLVLTIMWVIMFIAFLSAVMTVGRMVYVIMQ